jgi:2-iminoacetate synthase ThiH
MAVELCPIKRMGLVVLQVASVRVEQLVQAGELGVAFTTGLLLGIGETRDDVIVTLRTIADVHNECVMRAAAVPAPGGTQFLYH